MLIAMAKSICWQAICGSNIGRSEEHTSELQSQSNLVCRLLLEKKKRGGEEALERGGERGRARMVSADRRVPRGSAPGGGRPRGSPAAARPRGYREAERRPAMVV